MKSNFVRVIGAPSGVRVTGTGTHESAMSHYNQNYNNDTYKAFKELAKDVTLDGSVDIFLPCLLTDAAIEISHIESDAFVPEYYAAKTRLLGMLLAGKGVDINMAALEHLKNFTDFDNVRLLYFPKASLRSNAIIDDMERQINPDGQA